MKVRSLGGVSGSKRVRQSGLRIMEDPCGTVSPVFEVRDGRTRSTISTEISKVPFLLVLPLLTTNLQKNTETMSVRLCTEVIWSFNRAENFFYNHFLCISLSNKTVWVREKINAGKGTGTNRYLSIV